MPNTLTPEIYDASKPPEIRKLRGLAADDRAGRIAMGIELSQKGFRVDPEIDVIGWAPDLVMSARQRLGLLWYPNFSQPLLQNPFKLDSSVESNYDPLKPAPGSIPTSTDAEDYPPFETAPAPPLPPSPVGPFIGNGIWGADYSVVWPHGVWAFREGDTIQHDGKTLYFHIGYSIMGASPVWQETKP